VKTSLAPLTLALAAGACGSGNLASGLARAPDPGGDFRARCTTARPDLKPLVVALPSADKAEMEALAKGGPLVVHYEGCEMNVLARCTVRASYRYAGTTPKNDSVDVKSEDDLFAKLPVGGLSLAGKLHTQGTISVAMRIVGRFQSDATPDASGLSGDCAGATHWVAALTVGAYRMASGGHAQLDADVSALGASAGGASSASRETLSEDGDARSCASATESDSRPPAGCGAILRLELVPLPGGPS